MTLVDASGTVTAGAGLLGAGLLGAGLLGACAGWVNRMVKGLLRKRVLLHRRELLDAQ